MATHNGTTNRVLICVITFMLCLSGVPVFAETKVDVSEILSFVSSLARLVGIIFSLVGLVKYIISHSESNGPDMKQAVLMMAVGIILIMTVTILQSIDWSGATSVGTTTEIIEPVTDVWSVDHSVT